MHPETINRPAELQQILNTTGVGTWWAHQDRREIFADEGFRAITGLDVQNYPRIFARDYLACMAPEDQQQFHADREAEIVGQVYHRTRRLFVKGEERWVKNSLYVEESDQLGCRIVHGVIVDITDQIQGRELYEHWRAASDIAMRAAGVLVLELNLKTGFAQILSGHSDFPDVYSQMPALDFWVDYCSPNSRKQFEYAQANPGSRIELPVVNPKTGEHIYWMAVGFSEPYERAGERYQVAYRWVIEEYVSEREKALRMAAEARQQQALLSQQGKVLRLALAVTQTVVFEVDFETQIGRVFDGVSPVGAEFNGRTLAEGLRRVYTEADAQLVESTMRQPGKTVVVQTLDPHTGAPLYWSAITSSRPYHRDGQGYQLFARQIVTKQIEAQQLSEERAQRLEALVKELEQDKANRARMFAVIGHELRTPIAAMQMMLERAQEEDPNDLNLTLASNCQHLLSVLDDLRAVARPDELVSRDWEPVRVEQELKALHRLLAVLGESSGVTVGMELNLCVGLIALLPLQSLRQMLINLTKNAIIHSGGDRVLIKVRAKPVAQSVDLELSVIDNGKGLMSEHAQTLFEPFVRGQTDADGTGLGLYICRELAQAMNAQIDYRPADFGGSCFTFSGRFEKVGESTVDSQPNHQIFDGLSVLIVEDNLTLQMLTSAILKKAGAKVSVASNGEEGLAQLEQAGFDLLLSDIFMPKVDGYSLVRAARGRGFTGPIIGLTAATLGEETEKMLQAGADRVLSKPISINRLSEVINEIG